MKKIDISRLGLTRREWIWIGALLSAWLIVLIMGIALFIFKKHQAATQPTTIDNSAPTEDEQ